MKKLSFYFLSLIVASSLFIASGCNKDEDDDNNNNNTPATAPSSADLFNYNDAFGVLVGVKTVTTQSTPIGPFEIDLGTAVAVFSNNNFTSYLPAGTITCNTKNLDKQTNNSYVHVPAATDVNGIDFSSGSTWNVSGNADVNAVTNYTFSSFPTTPVISSNKDLVELSAGYTFSLSNFVSADTILFILASGNTYVEKRVGGGANSVTFSAADLATLQPSSQGLIQVTPYRLTSDLFGGKKYYFVNQVTVSDFAEFK